MINFNDSKLNLDSSWRIGEAAFQALTDSITRKIGQPKYLVEFGSGASSVRLALTFPQSQIISIEADQVCYQETQQLALEFLTASPLFDLQFKALNFEKYGTGIILTYQSDSNFSNSVIDCLIIDGPPFYTLRGREACLYQVYDQLPVGALVILDDFNREAEKTILNNWLSVYPNSFEVEILEVGHHLALLQKKETVTPIWDNPTRLKDSEQINQSYREIQSGLFSLKDSNPQAIIEILPNKFKSSWLNNSQDLEDFWQFVLMIQAVYEKADSKDFFSLSSSVPISEPEKSVLLTKNFHHCLELLGLSESA
ncbi:MAG: hypothetical protein ACRC6M_07715 [Microcystaceae cyanobacterium]